MKLFHAPGSCSVGIRCLLELAGADYDCVKLDLAAGQQNSPDFLAINPKGKVPALLAEPIGLLTEYPVIAQWIATHYSEAQLQPQDPIDQFRAQELTEYIVGSLHMRGSVFLMRPTKFTQIPEAQAQLRAHGHEVLSAGYAQLAERLGDKEWFFERPGVVDSAAFYLSQWSERAEVALPHGLAAFRARMRALPAVQRALA